MSRKNGKKRTAFAPPPHENAAVHALIMEELRKMTPEEVFQTAVDAGIYSPSGRLTRPYAPRAGDHLAK